MKTKYLITSLMVIIFALQSCGTDDSATSTDPGNGGGGTTTVELTDKQRVELIKSKGAYFEYSYSLDAALAKNLEFCQFDMLLYSNGNSEFKITPMLDFGTRECAQRTYLFDGTYTIEKGQHYWVLKIEIEDNAYNLPTEYNILEMEDNKDAKNPMVTTIKIAAVNNATTTLKPFQKVIFFKRDATKEPGKQ